MWRNYFTEFGEYSYIHEDSSKPELILFWIGDSTTILTKKTNILINSLKVNVNNIDRIDIVLGEYYGQGAFRFPIFKINIMDSEEHLNVKHMLVTYIVENTTV